MTTTYVSDSFNRANTTGGAPGVADTGQTWHGIFGSFDVQNNELVCDYGVDNISVIYIESGQSDCTISVDFTTFTDQQGIVFRWISGGSYWYCLFGAQSGGTGGQYGGLNPGVRLISDNSPSVTTVASNTTITPKSGDVAKLVLDGSTITVYLNDVQVLQATGQTFNQNATEHGIYENLHGNTGQVLASGAFDNFLITSNASAGPTEVDASTTGLSSGASSANGESVLYSAASGESSGESVAAGTVIVYGSAVGDSAGSSTAAGDTIIYSSATGSSSGDGTASTSSSVYATASGTSSGASSATGETWVDGTAAASSSGESSAVGLTLTVASAHGASSGESSATPVVADYAAAEGTTTGTGIAFDAVDVLASATGVSTGNSTTTTAVPVNAVITLQGSVIRTTNLQGSVLRLAVLQGSVVQTITLQGGLPLAVTNQNFEMYVGQEFAFEVTVLENGKPFDLTGATINWIMQPTVNSATATVSKSTGNGIVITDATNGVFEVTLLAPDTAGKQPYEYYHEAQVTDVSGNPYPVTIGTMELLASASTL